MFQKSAQRKTHCLINMRVYIFIYFYFSINGYIFLFTTEKVSRMLISYFGILTSNRFAMLENMDNFCFQQKETLSTCAEKKAVLKQFIIQALNINKTGFKSVI